MRDHLSVEVSGVDVQVVRSIRGLEGLRADWDRLSSRFSTPLLDHDWFVSAAAALHNEDQLRVVVVRNQEAITAIAPLAVDQRRRLVLLGASRLFEPSGWLYASNQDLLLLGEAVVTLGMPLLLQRIPCDSDIYRMLPRALRRRGIAIRYATAATSAVEFGDGASRSAVVMPGKERRKLRSRWSHAERDCGAATIERIRPTDPAAVDQLFGTLTTLEASGWKGRQGSALARKPELERFFHTYFRRAAGQGRLVVSVLTLGTSVAAVEFAVEAYRRLWTLKIAYDERLSSYGPGILLTDASIRATCSSGLDSYEFLGSSESWQQRWAPRQRPCALVAVYPYRAIAGFTALWDLAHLAAGRIAREAGVRQGS